ncbi:MAG: Mini-ribonuclease 3 [Clostridia bacterium]|nr:Mini-ribonuclease 3 [Clostridia bacterium]
MFGLGDTVDKNKILSVNPVVLAFVGDAVYSLFIRSDLALANDSKTGVLNKLATSKVKATAQAELIEEIMPVLTEEETAVFKRARNAKKPARSKSASVAEYNLSTGFEAVLGYLYLLGDYDRINYLLGKGNGNES